jgi:hypothetical protein
MANDFLVDLTLTEGSSDVVPTAVRKLYDIDDRTWIAGWGPMVRKTSWRDCQAPTTRFRQSVFSCRTKYRGVIVVDRDRAEVQRFHRRVWDEWAAKVDAIN